MNEQFDNFQQRVGRISHSHKRRVPYAFTVRPDGLLVPRTKSRLRFYFPWRAILAGFMVVVLTKASMIAALGLDGYNSRMETLLTGSAYEELATTILAPDPVSSWTAARITGALAVLGNL